MRANIDDYRSSEPNADKNLRESIERSRQQLLDLSARNNLLNYRLLKARGLEITRTESDEVFEALVTNGRQMGFQAVTSAGDEGDVQTNHRSTNRARALLPVEVDDDELQKRLLNTHDSARTAMEEQGVNTLFLAFGMLRWFEADSSQIPRYAPLILVPVGLRRRDASAAFLLGFSGEEIGTNLSLEAKLSTEFGVAVPQFDPEESTIADYCYRFQVEVSRLRNWKVDADRIVLAQFSFNKFLMYRDLDFETWPAHVDPLSHPVLQSLLSSDGFASQPSNYREEQFLDDVVRDEDHPMIIDADSSQTLALLDAMDGRTMVIQGPPGTGKSQTITNLIALAVGRGKTVLFVAEKMAALEVVKRRLDHLDLGVACLELHGTKTRKRRVLDDLAETLTLGEPRTPGTKNERARLTANRNWLNRYCQAMSSFVGKTEVSTFEALGNVVWARSNEPIDQWPMIELPEVVEWDDEKFKRLENLVGDLQAARSKVGKPSEHVFLGIRLSRISPAEQEDLRGLINRTKEILDSTLRLNKRVWDELSIEPKVSLAGIETAIATARRAASAHAQGKIPYADSAWWEQSDEIRSILDDGKTMVHLREKYCDVVNDDAWSADLTRVSELEKYRNSLLRWLYPGYWENRSLIDLFLGSGAPDGFNARFDIIQEIRCYQRLRTSIENWNVLGPKLFGDYWVGTNSDWKILSDLAESAITLHQAIREDALNSSLPSALDAGADRRLLEESAEELEVTAKQSNELFAKVAEKMEFDISEFSFSVPPLDQWSVKQKRELIERWRTNLATLGDWVSFRRALRECKEVGLKSIAEVAWSWSNAGEQLSKVFRYRRYLEIFDYSWRTSPVLASSGIEDKQMRLNDFRRLDREQLSWNRALLTKMHWAQLPHDGGGGELRVLMTEIQKKRRNLPIRQLMKRAGNAIQAVKPIFMMSPLSIANFIPPGSLEFDLVVFDEASQVAPVDALGAIVRAKQSIVVGDDKQLPPTNFFEKILDQNEELDEEFVSTQDMQSILNLFIAQNAPQRMLRWHYRSQHDSLIAVSNSEFYRNRLVIFPSPARDRDDLGLRFHHLSHTVYDRGKTKTNQGEAQEVANAVIRHAGECPDLTLGVAAFSISQAEAIRDHLEVLRRQDISTEAFFAEHPEEPFFIKNLENVQGDERDVIFISVGFGRDAHGRMTQNFGPVNKDGGERRLNVLITRARRRCEVFSNITDEDIPINTSSRGTRALKTFLHYARTSEFPDTSGHNEATESPFEEAVRQALESEGYEVHCQVGSAGYFIDLAIVDPERPGQYLLAIECDGASYHSARSSRDRDRLRQQVLERLGWTIHRIWSTDWFDNSGQEIKRATAVIESARERRQTMDEPDSTSPLPEPVPRENNGGEMRHGEVKKLPAYRKAQLQLRTRSRTVDDLHTYDLAPLILEVVRVEGPLHRSFVYRRLAAAFGIRRVGSRIQSKIDSIVEELRMIGHIKVNGEFVWPFDMESPPLRSRSELDSQEERKLEYVAPEELDLVIIEVIRRSYSISRDETVQIVIQLLGLKRSGHNAVAIVSAQLDELIAKQSIRTENGRLILASKFASSS